jgi:hypothetical protein
MVQNVHNTHPFILKNNNINIAAVFCNSSLSLLPQPKKINTIWSRSNQRKQPKNATNSGSLNKPSSGDEYIEK